MRGICGERTKASIINLNEIQSMQQDRIEDDWENMSIKKQNKEK